MTSAAPTEAARLARFVADLRYESIPAAASQGARLGVLDAIGVMVVTCGGGVGSQGQRLARRLGGPGQATAIGLAQRVSAADAALANGMLAHALDFDDSHSGSVTHPSAVVVPAALAAAELADADETSLLVAAIAGYEVLARVGGVAGSRFMDRGFHSTALAGAFGAAAACGKLLGLSEAQLLSAFGIVGSQAAGVLEFLADGTDAKQMHAGWAAHCGLYAALLAQEGLTGPASVLEGRFGLYRAHLGDGVLADGLADDLGTRWAVTEITYKAYPACHLTHTSIDALLAILDDTRAVPGEIASIHCEVPEFYVSKVLEPLAGKLRPRTSYEAKFSMPFCLASTAVHGRPDVSSFEQGALSEPAVLELAAKVGYEVVDFPEFPSQYPGAVTVVLDDGRSVRRAELENRRLTESELVEKFQRNCAGHLSAAATRRVADRILAIGRRAGSVVDLVAPFRFDLSEERPQASHPRSQP